ncbi:PREDICTED: enkurin [Propithecus coquereli]|uniref:enkurin n=1 Tax=Propithecus coquereli TaxID=379532 RepID=UPI00063FA3D9|nr:PREDICTED: enkurin [Propithecus coquereli]
MDPTCSSECIYNLIPRDLKEPPQPPRYISIFRTAVQNEVQKVKTAMKTMGPAKVEVPSPKDFLKKHSKEKVLPPKKKFDRNVPKKPAVPLRSDHPVMGIQSGKNFINTNAADVIMGVAKKPKPIYVDKRTGDKHDLETSGLLPKYINKKVDFFILLMTLHALLHGKNKYSNITNRANKYSQWEFSTQLRKEFGLRAVFLVTVAKYLIIDFSIYSFLYHLQGLKKNWEEVHKEFQSLSVFIDSTPKKMRKQRLEEEMKQLEHDIAVIEKHKIIYIANK